MDTDKNLDYYIYRLLDRDTRPTIIMGLYQEQFFLKKKEIFVAEMTQKRQMTFDYFYKDFFDI